VQIIILSPLESGCFVFTMSLSYEKHKTLALSKVASIFYTI